MRQVAAWALLFVVAGCGSGSSSTSDANGGACDSFRNHQKQVEPALDGLSKGTVPVATAASAFGTAERGLSADAARAEGPLRVVLRTLADDYARLQSTLLSTGTFDPADALPARQDAAAPDTTCKVLGH